MVSVEENWHTCGDSDIANYSLSQNNMLLAHMKLQGVWASYIFPPVLQP